MTLKGRRCITEVTGSLRVRFSADGSEVGDLGVEVVERERKWVDKGSGFQSGPFLALKRTLPTVGTPELLQLDAHQSSDRKLRGKDAILLTKRTAWYLVELVRTGSMLPLHYPTYVPCHLLQQWKLHPPPSFSLLFFQASNIQGSPVGGGLLNPSPHVRSIISLLVLYHYLDR